MTSQYELDKRRCRRMNILRAIAERHTRHLSCDPNEPIGYGWDKQYERAAGYRNPRHAIRTSNHEFDRLMTHTPKPFDMLGLV